MKPKHLAAIALLLGTAANATAPKSPAPKCQLVTVGQSQVWAKRLPSGNFSATACEVEMVIRYTKRTKTYEIRPTKDAWRCTAWVNPIAVPPVNLEDVETACHAAMDKAPH